MKYVVFKRDVPNQGNGTKLIPVFGELISMEPGIPLEVADNIYDILITVNGIEEFVPENIEEKPDKTKDVLKGKPFKKLG